MANQVRPWLVKPRMSAAPRVRESDWEPASQSHQGQRHAPQQKSGCTGALSPCKPSRTESLARLGASMYGQSVFGVEGWIESLTPEIASFGIRTMLVEPGFFRTELLSTQSTTYAKPYIDDYAERTRETVTAWS